MKIIVSGCLAGNNCRYDGGNIETAYIKQIVKDGNGIIICPECFGGLTTPRLPSEIRDNQVFASDGNDVTSSFVAGAQKALKIAQANNITLAILKEESPSCGNNRVYDGSFSGKIIDGIGITAKLFRENGIIVLNEMEGRKWYEQEYQR